MSKLAVVKAQKVELILALEEIMDVCEPDSEPWDIADETLRYIADKDFLSLAFREVE